jgi:hypothetical protein
VNSQVNKRIIHPIGFGGRNADGPIQGLNGTLAEDNLPFIYFPAGKEPTNL